MRVGLDARTLAAAVRSGVEHYVANLVRAFSQLDDSPETMAYVDHPIPDPDLARAASSGSVRTKLVQARFGWLRLALPWRLWRDRTDLVHLPSTIIPPFLPCPAVVTVHDLAWAHYPEAYRQDDLRMQRVAVRGAAQRAARIIAVSETTALDLHARFAIPKERISVIPLAVSPRFSAEGPRLSGRAFPGAERLAAGYLLYVGRLDPRKNLLRLLEAYRRLCAGMPTPPLVLAGPTTAHASELAAAAQRLAIEGQVIFAGYVPEDELPALYRSAGLFLYPSLYEGFGLPVLEAMACGIPAIASDRSSLPEVAGDAALLVDPENVERLTEAMSLLLTDEALRTGLIARGLARSRLFTWERTARETIEVYRQVAARG